jgi:hypothetical protein
LRRRFYFAPTQPPGASRVYFPANWIRPHVGAQIGTCLALPPHVEMQSHMSQSWGAAQLNNLCFWRGSAEHVLTTVKDSSTQARPTCFLAGHACSFRIGRKLRIKRRKESLCDMHRLQMPGTTRVEMTFRVHISKVAFRRGLTWVMLH